jgi:hypothetical protein
MEAAAKPSYRAGFQPLFFCCDYLLGLRSTKQFAFGPNLCRLDGIVPIRKVDPFIDALSPSLMQILWPL